MGTFATFKIKLQDLVSPQLGKISNRFKGATNDAKKFEKVTNKSATTTRKKLSALNNIGRLAAARNGMSAFSASSRVAAAGINPIVAGIGLATIGALKLGVSLVKSSAQLESNLQVTTQLLGGTTQETKKLTAQATALSKVYGDDYTSTIQTASNLAKEFGIDNAQAFALLEKGYASGANVSGDMLKKLEDSSHSFKKLGATADEQMAILQQSVSNGIKDTPKLLEAFGKNLPNLGGDTTRLLDQAFGKSFTSTLKSKIKKGEVPAITALKAISNAVYKTNLGKGAAEGLAQQIFGDDSGNAVQLLSNFSTFETSLDNLVGKNQSFNKTKDEQLKLEKQLAAAQLKTSKAFSGNTVKVFGLKMKIAFFNGINTLGSLLSTVGRAINSFTTLTSKIASVTGVTFVLKTAWTALSTAFSTTWAVIKGTVGGLFTFMSNAFKAIHTLIDQVLGSSFVQKMKTGFNSIKTAVGSMLSYITTPLSRLGDALMGVFEILKGIKNFDYAQITAGLSDFKSGLMGVTQKKREKEGLNSKKIGKEIANSQSKTLEKLGKEKDVFKLQDDNKGLSNKSKTQLNNGINSITTGGTQTRNLTVNIEKMSAIETLYSTVDEAKGNAEEKLTELLVKVLQGAEYSMNRG